MTYPRVPVVKTPDWERRAASALNDSMNRIDVLANGAVEQATAIAEIETEVAALETTVAAIDAVVGLQQPAIVDDASGAVNQATVNAILAALRAHGLIAP